MTQRQLALRVGFSAANPISKLETGRSAGIDALLLQRIGQAADVWLPYLLGESNEMRPYAMGKSPTEATMDLSSLEREVTHLRGQLEGLSETLTRARTRGTVAVPLLGRIPAGSLQETIEHPEEVVPIPRWWVRHADRVFLLHVVGDSMAPTLQTGDLVLVMPGPTADEGDIVVAAVGTEVTLKRYHRQRKRVVLKADNPAYEDIVVSAHLRINGRVIALLRRFKGA